MKYFLRWTAVLPGAILAGLLATFPLHWILIFWIFPHDGRWFLDFIEFQNQINISGIELALTPLVIATFYIWIGSEIAPEYKFITASVLATLYVGVIIYFFFAADGQATFDIKTACALLGVLLGLLIVWFRLKKVEHVL